MGELGASVRTAPFRADRAGAVREQTPHPLKSCPDPRPDGDLRSEHPGRPGGATGGGNPRPLPRRAAEPTGTYHSRSQTVYRTFPRGSHDPARAPRPRRPRRLQLEPLEGRQLMSLGDEFIANTTVRNDQLESDGAIAANGISVAVWVDTFSGTDHDIRAQIYNADGTLRGKEIVVEGSSAEARRPSVAIDHAGNFVVAWEQTVNGQKDIRAELYTDTGIKTQPNTIKVTTDGRNEFDPDVAMDGAGNWGVAYSLQFSPTYVDVRAARFSGPGDFLLDIPTATSTALAATGPTATL